ncbi:YedE family putative selenium transporter [Proteinivorax hydrogeniformans]|uniref:YedE family putative selenium transporter n=1 Tax=Proteinivorax hydrogeniformans TaxID=1826727 RepID=A0AAU8HSS1_9FIRM
MKKYIIYSEKNNKERCGLMKKLLSIGIIVGFIGAILTKLGNPVNMGFCIACFLRDIAGGLNMHQAGIVQYLRPEVAGLVLGAFIIALVKNEFKVEGGSAPLLRFFIAIFMMVGAMVFLGCPLRMVLRIAGGDLNAIVGLFGFIFGIYLGLKALKGGFTLGKATKQENKTSGYIMPAFFVMLLIFVVVKPEFINFSSEGPGSFTAPILVALGTGLIVGILAQRSRLCMAGGIRDVLMIKDFHMVSGFIGILVAALITNIAIGKFNLGFAEQNVAHTEHIWNFLGLALVGFCAILLGGCPLRQLILAGQGNLDAATTVLGLIVGGAVVHNFGTAASPAGVPTNGKIGVVICFIILAVIVFTHSKKIIVRRDKDVSIGR